MQSLNLVHNDNPIRIVGGTRYPFGSVTNGLQYGCVTAADTAKQRYGMYGQAMVDEVSGAGNSYTAEFWQYDGSLGRRFNRYPSPNHSISNYACMANNTIFYADPNGDTSRVYNISSGLLIESLDDGSKFYTYKP